MTEKKIKNVVFQGRNFLFRQAKGEDADRIFFLLQEASAFFRRLKIPQWQDGYPSREDVCADIRRGYAFLLTEEERSVGTVSFCPGHDPSYDYVCSGGFRTESYVVLHRLAVANEEKGKNIAELLISLCGEMAKEQQIASLRVDTILENVPMCRVLDKACFSRCAEIDPPHQGGKRVCFEYLLA